MAEPELVATLPAGQDLATTAGQAQRTERSRGRLTNILLFLIASLLVILISSIVFPGPGKYEYRVISPHDERLVTELDQLGARGWEVVSSRRATGEGRDVRYEMILKRRYARD